MPTRTTGYITAADWQERKAGPAETSPRLALASVVNTFTGGIEAADTTCEYVIAYATEKTGTFAGMELLTGTLDGRAGAFVLDERGTFEPDGSVRCTFEVVPGSGTGALTGLTGTGSFVYRPGEPSFPYTFDYELGPELS
ncbi:DUF3224 domain-containing protein [Kitasatospora aureofaciens]|uniref:DUF3224 domain-containing protein n=1 Tax=Kitasatospora aureofaciens TaxID=1894 RepID=UPI001C4388A0|nr:DUF3224 domain-containing protein [Kitasatospora aureofaciens]MBV6700456.1 DUF3224 domain-containing protein [Kitasatospora aureofaciens]